nr:bifunctional DNA primase/polymerase [Streptomonospora sp. PA3]
MHIPDIDPDRGTIAAALDYADAGWYVLPVDPGTKHPGSVLGKGWPAKSSRDRDTITDWFVFGGYALALHVGRSGAVVFDVDRPEAVPPELAQAAADLAPPFQSTREHTPNRGHYVFAEPAGRTLGNGAGSLGRDWGEVRGKNGIIVVSPSEHERAAEGGRYEWVTTGPVPELPAALAAALPDASQSADAATDTAVRAFLDEHTRADRPSLITPIVQRFTADVAAARSRHESMLLPAANAMREARAGLYSAHAAATALQNAFTAALATSRDGTERAIPADTARAEFAGILAWAIAQAQAAPAEEITGVVDGADERAPDEAQMIAELLPFTAPPAPTADGAGGVEGALATVHQLDADERERTSWWPRSLSAILSGAEEEPPPALLARDDGARLWYAGKVNGLQGESESGKTWIALLGVAQALADGQRVAYLDFEDTPAGIVSRLRAIGVPDDQFGRLDYIGPDEALHMGARGDLTEYIDHHRPALAVVDGVNAAMTLMGLDLTSNTDATKFTQTLLKPLTATGAAVVAVDHVPKAKESRGKGGIGAQAKRAMMTGCSITVEVAAPFGRGMKGRLRLLVDKDRPGFVRAVCSEAKYAGTAILQSDRNSGAVGVVIRAPEDAAENPAAEGTAAGAASARIRGLMEAVSTYLATEPERTSLRGIRDVVKGRPDDVAEAVETLVADGYVTRAKSGQAYTHTLVRPYSTLDDLIARSSDLHETSETTSEPPADAPETGNSDVKAETGTGFTGSQPVSTGSETTFPGPGGTGFPVPLSIERNREPSRPGAPEPTETGSEPPSAPAVGTGRQPDAKIIVIDGRIIAMTDRGGVVLTPDDGDLVDATTGEIYGRVDDLPHQPKE